MKRCLNCMKEHEDNGKYCPYCGYESDQKTEGYELPPGTVLEDRYTIGTIIGIGGFGIIYRAWDNKLETMVAVKECFPTGLVKRSPGQTVVSVVKNKDIQRQYKGKVRRFLGEAQTMARFSEHENIVHVFDYFEANNTAYFVMEYLDGCNLKNLSETHQLSVDESVNIIVQICEILKYMHGENIIHRDITPNNIMICRNGKIKLIDFGTARAQFGELSKAITAELTPGYAPPEQYQVNGNQGAWTDVYALCATLYHMVTGVKPEESTDRVGTDRLVSPMKLNPDVPEWLDRVIMSGMAVDYRLRIQNVNELQNALNRRKKALYPVEKIDRQKKRRTLSLAALLLVLLISAGALLANRAAYHGWFTEDGVVTIWLPDNSFGKSMEGQAAKYEERYGGKKLEITLIDELSYSKRLLDAAEADELPDVFYASGAEETFPDKLADVKEILDEEGDENHFLLHHNLTSLAEGRRIPLSFNTLVLYENTSVSGASEHPYQVKGKFDLSRTKPSDDSAHTLYDSSSPLTRSVIRPISGSDGKQGALSEFTDSSKQTVPYFFGSTADRRTVQNALAGYNEIYGVSDGDTMYAEFCDQLCFSGRSYEQKKALTDLLIHYLLSESAQSDMYLQNDKPLPVERETFSHYVETISSLSFLKDEYEHFEIVDARDAE